ncbi:MAG: carbon-nitrogen hydrolase family protein [Gammaproteobacteria bacterium]
MSRIALAQTTSTDDLEANLRAANALIAEAAAGDAALLAFPEVFLYIGGRARKLEIAEPLDGPLVSQFREAAARHGMMLLLGSLHERIAGNEAKVHNTSVLIGADGSVLSVYRKMKLFDVELPGLRIKESDTIEAGTELAPVVRTAIGAVGLSICFDLRFAHLYGRLRRDGAEVIFVPSNFTAPTGGAHWSVLLRARAVENQLFVVAPAQYGEHNPRYRSYGHSLVVDPWGEVLVEAPDRPGLVYADIDLGRVADVRRNLPMD